MKNERQESDFPVAHFPVAHFSYEKVEENVKRDSSFRVIVLQQDGFENTGENQPVFKSVWNTIISGKPFKKTNINCSI